MPWALAHGQLGWSGGILIVYGIFNFNTAYNENHHDKYNNIIHKYSVKCQLLEKRIPIIGI